MDYYDFYKEGINDTEKESIKEIRKIIAFFAIINSDIKKAIYDFYDTYSLSKGSYKSIYEWGVLTGNLNNLKQDIIEIMSRDCPHIRNSIHKAFSNMYYRSIFAFNYVNKQDIVTKLPNELINLVVNSSEDDYKNYINSGYASIFGDVDNYKSKYISVDETIDKNKDSSSTVIITLLLASILNGKSKSATYAKIKPLVGYIDKSKHAYGELAKSIRVARSNVTRALNAGIYASNISTNTFSHKKWVAVIDIKTRNQSLDMDGQLVLFDGYFTYPNGATSKYPGMSGVPAYDINDRCSMLPLNPEQDIIKSNYNWLGLDEFLEDSYITRDNNNIFK